MSGGAKNGQRGYMLTFGIAYIRDFFNQYGIVGETFEASMPWTKIHQVTQACVRNLREELVRKTAEADKFRELYVRAKREVDRLRAEAKKSALEGIYSQNAPDGGPAGDSESDAARGGKFFFRSKKKK